MFSCYQTIRRPVTHPITNQFGLKRPLTTKRKPEDDDHKLFTFLLNKFRHLFGPQFMKRFSSSSICHCIVKQQGNSPQQPWIALRNKQYQKSHYIPSTFKTFLKFFSTSTIPLALAVFTKVKADSSCDDSEEDQITDELMESHKSDLKYIKSLIMSTLTCKTCEKRHVIDQTVDNIEYCKCKDKKPSVYGVQVDEKEAWTPFLERKNILVWRQEHPQLAGLYAYKMYGKFDDVSANEFLSVQVDTSEFRLSWDRGTAQCHILEQKKSAALPDSREVNHVYYWEVNWPRFFSNRDYVCLRRAKIFKDEGSNSETFVLFAKSTDHPSCPKKAKAHRVENYWSVLTIKPTTTSDQPGLEFSLTGFENPGLSLPSYVTTWVAIQAMPEFFTNLRKACVERRKWLKKSSSSSNSNPKEPSYLETPKHHYANEGSRNYA